MKNLNFTWIVPYENNVVVKKKKLKFIYLEKSNSN